MATVGGGIGGGIGGGTSSPGGATGAGSSVDVLVVGPHSAGKSALVRRVVRGDDDGVTDGVMDTAPTVRAPSRAATQLAVLLPADAPTLFKSSPPPNCRRAWSMTACRHCADESAGRSRRCGCERWALPCASCGPPTTLHAPPCWFVRHVALPRGMATADYTLRTTRAPSPAVRGGRQCACHLC